MGIVRIPPRRVPAAAILAVTGMVAAFLSVAISAGATVFHSKESALALAFPRADRVESRTLVLSADQVRAVEARSKTRVESKLVRVYEGMRGEESLGFAFIETHTVRSLPETILVVLGPDGRSRGVHLLAFHEPPEYRPPASWLRQFEDRELDDELSLRRGVAGIGGSTLTATAITASVRRIMATFEVCLTEVTGVASVTTEAAEDLAP